MSNPDEITQLRLRPRETETVPLSIPMGTLATIREVAETRDMSPEALIRFYIGPGCGRIRPGCSRSAFST